MQDNKYVMNFIENTIYVLLFSVICFGFIDSFAPKFFKNYLIIFVALYIIIFLRYRKLKNWNLFLNCIIFFGIFVILRITESLLLATVLIILCLAYLWRVYNVCNKHYKPQSGNGNNYTLFPQQEDDLQVLKRYLENYNLFGINGLWGCGKTFLLEHLQQEDDIKNKYEFITINLLSCNLDEVEQVVLKEIEKVITANKLYTSVLGSYRKLYKSDNTYLTGIQTLFGEQEPSIKDIFSKYRRCLDKLDNKETVVVFEDIDRISDSNDIEGKRKLRKIFSIGEFLTRISNKVKVIYTFDFDELKERGFDRKYLEKYIPQFLNLTLIEWDTILRNFINKKNDNYGVKVEDFTFLHIPYSTRVLLKGNDLPESIDFRLHLKNTSIRRTQNLLDDINFTFKHNKEYLEDKVQKRIVITFSVMKCFYFDLYRQLNNIIKPIDSFIFFSSSKQKFFFNDLRSITYADIETQREIFADLFLSSDNKYRQDNVDKLVFLYLFGYDIEFLNEKSFYQQQGDKKDWFKIQSNEKITQTIWHLLVAGKHKETDNQKAVELFVSEVLQANNKVEAFKWYWNNYFTGKYKQDYGVNTIFLIGHSAMSSIFQAMCVYNYNSSKEKINNKDWKDAIDFLFEYYTVKQISKNLINSLCFVDISREEILFYVMEKFCSLNVIGNFNGYKYYKIFLRDYLNQLVVIGLVSEVANYYVSAEISTNNANEQGVTNKDDASTKLDLKHILDQTKKEKDKLLKDSILNNEYSLALSFIQKNIEICQHDRVINDITEPDIKTKVKSAPNMKIEKFTNLYKEMNKEEWELYLSEKYHNNELYISEVVRILEIVKNNY